MLNSLMKLAMLASIVLVMRGAQFRDLELTRSLAGGAYVSTYDLCLRQNREVGWSIIHLRMS
jgi:hypothetical protein